MSDIYKSATKDGFKLEVVYDEFPESPRDWSNLGMMVCWHRRYSLGDKHNYNNPIDFKEEINDTNAIILPLYLYDHSGITMSINPFSCSWDSGQVGYIYAMFDKIKEEYSVIEISEELRQKVSTYLKGEVETYDKYLRGDIYGFRISKINDCSTCHHKEYEEIDSCYGFYGTDFKENGMMDHIEDKYHYLFAEL